MFIFMFVMSFTRYRLGLQSFILKDTHAKGPKLSVKIDPMVSKLHVCELCFKHFTNCQNLDWSKLKAFADNKINLLKKLKFGMGKGRKHR